MKKDLIRKRYFTDRKRFADLINGYFLEGSQLIHPSDLHDMDSQSHYNQKARDIIRKVALGVNFAVIGIENQEQVHYLMPLRTMLYDGAEYERQATEIAKDIRENYEKYKPDSAEFLSGFTKEHFLYPCITVVLYWGEEWNGARDLYDLLNLRDIPEKLKPYINHYPIHLLNVRELEDTSVFHTDLRQVFEFIKNSDNKEKLKQLVEADVSYRNLDEAAYDMIACCTNTKILTETKNKYRQKEGINMCRALTELIEDGREEGRNEGFQKGWQSGMEKLTRLNMHLIELGKYEELKLVQTDSEYREKMLKEYGFA